MAGSRAGRLLPWGGGRFGEVAGLDDLVAPWAGRRVAAITAFNAPVNRGAHKVAPARAAGNCVVVKPAPQAPAPALRLAEILTEAGFPPGAVNVVPGGRETGAALLADPRVDLVSFTGGTAAGREIRAAAGLRPVLLELGGNSANPVCADAELPLAPRECLPG